MWDYLVTTLTQYPDDGFVNQIRWLPDIAHGSVRRYCTTSCPELDDSEASTWIPELVGKNPETPGKARRSTWNHRRGRDRDETQESQSP